MAADLLRPLGLTLQSEPRLHTLLLSALPLRSLLFYYFLSCAAAAGSLPGLDYDYGISPKFVCTPIPPDADPSCFSPPGPPHAPGGASSHANDHPGGTRRGAMSDEAKATILHLRESLVRQKETILDQRETIRELTAKLTLCEGFGGHHSTGHRDSHHDSDHDNHPDRHGGHHDDHHVPHGGHHPTTSHHGPSGFRSTEDHYDSHRPDPHHRKSPPSSFSPEQTGKTLQTLKERLENLQARNSSSSYSSSLRELLQRKINALEEQLHGYYRDHHDDHHDDHHGQHDDHHGNGHHDDHHGNGHHDDHHGNGHHDDHHGNGHHDDHHGNGHHDDHHGNGHHDDHHGNGHHDDHHSNGRHDDHHSSGRHDDHHSNGRHDDHHGNGHHDDHHGNGHHDDHHSSRGHHGTYGTYHGHHGGHHSRHHDHHYDRRHGHHGYHGNHHSYHHNDHHDDHHNDHHNNHHGYHDDHHDNHHDDHHDTHHGGDHHDDHHDYHHGYGHLDDHHSDHHDDHHHDDKDHHMPFGGKETGQSKLETVLSQLHHDHGNQKKLKSPSAFLLDFPMRTNYMYARMKRSLTNEIFAMTVCLWLKAGAGPGLGTPFSYAVPGQANELVLMEWGANPMELLINDKAVTLPVTLSDHKWHHVCVTWATRDGTWEVYQDGVKKGSGQNLSAWQPIKPGGVFILGQEQDTLGGRFDVTQSFMGQLADLQLWSRVLTPTEIHSQATCGGHLVGDVLWWHEEAVELHGGLAELPFDACH